MYAWCLPTFTHTNQPNVGKYTVRPMDPMGPMESLRGSYEQTSPGPPSECSSSLPFQQKRINKAMQYQ